MTGTGESDGNSASTGLFAEKKRVVSPLAPSRTMTRLTSITVNVNRPSLPTLSPTLARTSLPSANRRSEEHTSELQSLMLTSYAVFCLKKKHKYRSQYQLLT